MMNRFASVDIGSNTIKVTIADYLGDGRFQKIFYKDYPSCLGHNMSEENIIDPTALSSCYNVLNDIKKILQEYKVHKHKNIATHALREAVNQQEILALIKSNTGIDVDVISGETEAGLTLKAILMDLPPSKNYACINAGGGSTELSFYIPDLPGMEKLYFFRFGAVNLYKDFIENKQDIEKAVFAIGDFISGEFRKINISIQSNIDQVVSVGGSVYNAAYIFKKDRERNFNKLAKMRLSVSDLETVINQLKYSSDEEKKQMPGMDPGRMNTTLPGILIHYYLLRLLKKDELVISTRSISDGVIYLLAEGGVKA
jgi:exopolyphosphatase/guanosine-5'-triphosphate,3'-diphosphate pyrophosphatase